MSEIESLKKDLKRKERSTKILKAEIENLKRKLSEQDVGPLMKKIEYLEGQLKKKNKEINDLKSVTSGGIGGTGGSSQELKTKLIILQSKMRKINQENEKYKKELNDLKMQNSRMKKKSGLGESADALKNELSMYKSQNDRYRAQLSDLDQINARSQKLELQVSSLQQQLASKKASPVSNEFNEFSGNAEDGLVQKYKNIVAERDASIEQLQQQVSSGGGGGFMAQNRANRKVAELEAQINMLKRNEADMKRRYEDAMRKLSSADEFAGW